MKQNIVHKVPQGKLLRIEVEIENSMIKEIKITGDFFIHPEKAICEIEEFLVDKEVQKVEEKLLKLLKEKNIKIVGFTPEDLQKSITKF